MLELLALPVALIILSFLIINRDVIICMRGFSIVYLIDYFIGGWLFTTVETFYLSMIATNVLLLFAAYTLKCKCKAIICYSIIVLLITLNLNEHLHKYQTMFYPYLDYLSYWSGELLTIIITWNVKWKTYDFKFNSKRLSN
jgi:hypothetical protein